MIVADASQKIEEPRLELALCVRRNVTIVESVVFLVPSSGTVVRRNLLIYPHVKWISLTRNTSRSNLPAQRSLKEATPPQCAASRTPTPPSQWPIQQPPRTSERVLF